MEPLVSVGMPVFNDRRFISKALDSILAQSYTSFELILSDDCSSDGSGEICKEYALKDPRIRYIRQDNNIGISRNMEFLLKAAKGKYFMWAGNDDLWDRHFIATLVREFNESEKLVSVFCPMYFIDENDNILLPPGIRATDYSGENAYCRLKKLVRCFDDSFGYGLFLREQISGVRFPVWWWVNKKCAYNNIYPTLCYYLSKGDFRLAGARPLWFNRLKEEKNINHKVPYNQSFLRGFLSFALRKLNLVVFSLVSIYAAKKSIVPAVQIFPSMFYNWFVKTSYAELRLRSKGLMKGTLNFW